MFLKISAVNDSYFRYSLIYMVSSYIFPLFGHQDDWMGFMKFSDVKLFIYLKKMLILLGITSDRRRKRFYKIILTL